MRKIEVTKAFRRDFKRESKGRYKIILETDLKQVIDHLSNDVPLTAKYRDHALTGNWKDYRDCHIRPDLVLITDCLKGMKKNLIVLFWCGLAHMPS